MQQASHYWQQADALDKAGDHAAARDAYAAVLAGDADHAAAWLRLGRLERIADHYRQAVDCALRAADAVRNRQAWRNLSFVTLRLLELDQRQRATELIRQADWQQPAVLQQAAVLAQHLYLAGEYQVSLALIELANRHVGAHHLLSYERGNALRAVGDMDGASLAYEQAIDLRPVHALAHWALASHRPAHSLQRIERLRQALAGTPESSEDSAYLQYALFKEYDAAGAHEPAWTALEAGAAIKHNRLIRDPDLEARNCERLRQLALPATDEARHTNDHALTPIFIVGMPRTGTTVLERILDNHPGVVSAGELNDFNSAVSMAADHFFIGGLLQRDWQVLETVDWQRVGELYLQRIAPWSKAARFVVDKHPANFFNAAWIARALPHAKILCLLKEPMDACFSNLKELFAGDAYSYSYDQRSLAQHYRQVRTLAGHWQQRMPSRFKCVGYNELVREPATMAADIARFCGIEYDPGSVRIERNHSPTATASNSQVRTAIHDASIDAWKSYAQPLRPLQTALAGD
ncbi:tetratricopeptide repeat-containing sulfotransferase family protein [Pseudoxanthomonas dokdonensis]|uniref:Uncharacterized protein n=1 Tax=Pseudoxanthomonas dokdonensis TaxID=344882 RepID=A0A0R0CJM0_9GAMM|nr:sulfotransferase [Pseudoxanthomonas dokdonensis]KRG70137.1 hypothetical protein ABB29_07920 [Pseudoxanthomonas dokdonensis]